MELFNFYLKPVPECSNYFVDASGNIYRQDMSIMKPFKSNKYLQVRFKDDNNKRRILGVHQVVAMTYLSYYKGCVVHHKNEDTHDNNLYNLEICDRSEHSRHHANPCNLINYIKIHGAPNKGKHPSIESRLKMSESAKKRHSK